MQTSRFYGFMINCVYCLWHIATQLVLSNDTVFYHSSLFKDSTICENVTDLTMLWLTEDPWKDACE